MSVNIALIDDPTDALLVVGLVATSLLAYGVASLVHKVLRLDEKDEEEED